MSDPAGDCVPKRDYPGLPEADAAALTLRYQQGDREALARLHQDLHPAILAALRRYRAGGLPSTLTFQDLEQQSWIVLADLVGRWRPSGSFLAYFFRSFPHDMARFVQRSSPNRQTRAVQVTTLPHDDLLTRMGRRPGADPCPDEGALCLTADSALGLNGVAAGGGAGSGNGSGLMRELAQLTAPQRAAFFLHTLDGHDFATIGRILEMSRASAHRLYHQALRQLRSPESTIAHLEARRKACRTGSGHVALEEGLRRVVRLLHLTAGRDGRLAGRRRVAEAAGLNRREYSAIIARLEAAGAMVERAPTRAGRLVEPTPDATLRRVLSAEC